jgi:hypothetical protein
VGGALPAEDVDEAMRSAPVGSFTLRFARAPGAHFTLVARPPPGPAGQDRVEKSAITCSPEGVCLVYAGVAAWAPSLDAWVRERPQYCVLPAGLLQLRALLAPLGHSGGGPSQPQPGWAAGPVSGSTGRAGPSPAGGGLAAAGAPTTQAGDSTWLLRLASSGIAPRDAAPSAGPSWHAIGGAAAAVAATPMDAGRPGGAFPLVLAPAGSVAPGAGGAPQHEQMLLSTVLIEAGKAAAQALTWLAGPAFLEMVPVVRAPCS